MGCGFDSTQHKVQRIIFFKAVMIFDRSHYIKFPLVLAVPREGHLRKNMLACKTNH
jgi:hypothetical protein